MIDTAVVAEFVGFAAEKIKFYGAATFQFTKSSFNHCIEKVNKEKIQEYASSIVVCCRDNLADMRYTTRFYLRPDNVEMFLKRISEQVFFKNRVDVNCICLFNDFLQSRPPYKIDCNKTNFKWREPNESFDSLLVKIIWYEFDRKSKLKYMSKSDKTIQKWNKRVNEKDLVKKLGSPIKWDIFYDKSIQDEKEKERQKEPELKDIEHIKPQNIVELENFKLNAGINQLQKAERQKRYVMMKSNSFLTNDLQQPYNAENTKHKKKNGVIHSIKKMFKTDKSSAASRPSASQQQSLLGKYSKSADNLDSNAEKSIQNSSINKGNSSLSKYTKDDENERARAITKQTNTYEADDTDNNSLMIHIPTNVQKIVLVKDGHKIKLEI